MSTRPRLLFYLSGHLHRVVYSVRLQVDLKKNKKKNNLYIDN